MSKETDSSTVNPEGAEDWFEKKLRGCLRCGTLPLVWTKTPPTEPGWYWRSLPTRRDVCIVVEIFWGPAGSGMFFVSRDGVSAYPLHGGDGIGHFEWAGPIPMPRKP